jgi:hypothetical protein
MSDLPLSGPRSDRALRLPGASRPAAAARRPKPSTDATLAWTAILCAVAALVAATAGRSRLSTATTVRDPVPSRQVPEARVQ